MIKPIAGIIKIGYATDNLAEVVNFDVQNIIEAFGSSGSWTLTIMRPTEKIPYLVNPENLAYADGHLLWTVTDTETALSGRGAVQLKYTVSEIVKNTQVYEINVGKSLVSDTPVPDVLQIWVNRFAEFENELAGKISAPETPGEAGQVLGLNEDLEPVWVNGGGGGDGTVVINADATVDGTTGTPDVTVTKTGTQSAPTFHFAFSGLKGVAGERGPAGETGPQGERGLTGETGPQGETGPAGPAGPQGERGPAGTYTAGNGIQINGDEISAVETDPTVPAWAKSPTKPAYTAAEVGIMDTGNYFTTDTVEGALQELGALTNGIEQLLAAI